MAVENVTYIDSLDPTAPAGGDSISEGDDHIRNIKRAIKDTFPNVDGPVELTTAEFSALKSGLASGGIVASCKYNGTSVMYQEGVSSVTQVGNGGYRVTFDSQIPGFDNHYAPLITAFASPNNRPVVVALTGFTDSYVEFVMQEFDGSGNATPSPNTGFSFIIVDMITN